MLQGKVISLLLFACFIADLEEFLRSEGIRGVALNHFLEILLLAYVDDLEKKRVEIA